MRKLQKLNPLPTPKADQAFCELYPMMKLIRQVRNNVVHAVILKDDNANQVFELRSNERRLTKAQVFETEELTNYAAHAALILRHELGDPDPHGPPPPLPGRPAI